MKIKKLLEHKIEGGRNSGARNILPHGSRIFVSFLYDKGSFYESVLKCLNIEDFSVVWEYKHPHVIFSLLISQHGTLIASFMNGNVKAFQLETGNIEWEFKVEGTNIGMLSNESEGKIVFSRLHQPQTTWCIDTENGNTLWNVPVSDHSYVPHIWQNKVYNTAGHYIFCTSFANGSTIWENKEPDTYLTNNHIFKDLVIASGHGKFNGYDLQTGQLRFTAQTGSGKAIGSMVSQNDCIYFGDESGAFYCYQITGTAATLQWKIQTGAAEVRRPAIIDGERLFIAAEDFGFLCIDKHTGATILAKKAKGKGSAIAIHENKVYFATKMTLFAFEMQ